MYAATLPTAPCARLEKMRQVQVGIVVGSDSDLPAMPCWLPTSWSAWRSVIEIVIASAPPNAGAGNCVCGISRETGDWRIIMAGGLAIGRRIPWQGPSFAFFNYRTLWPGSIWRCPWECLLPFKTGRWTAPCGFLSQNKGWFDLPPQGGVAHRFGPLGIWGKYFGATRRKGAHKENGGRGPFGTGPGIPWGPKGHQGEHLWDLFLAPGTGLIGHRKISTREYIGHCVAPRGKRFGQHHRI